MTDDAPLILTLEFEESAFARFQALRQEHFPAKRNMIPAHLTLFHHLPGDRHEAIVEELGDVAGEYDPIRCEVSGLRHLGKGVAFEVSSHRLERMRNDLAGDWFDWLTAQDRQRFKPHITFQNKVEPERAKALFEEMEAEFEPFNFFATGLLLWRYRGGPWETVDSFRFGEAAPQVDDTEAAAQG